MKKLSKFNIFSLLAALTGFTMFIISLVLTTEISTKKCKKYIIEHVSLIYKNEHGFKIDTCIGLPYYTDITIRMDSDSSYNVVFWGNRESFLWDFRLDKSFSVDIPYEKYKKHNTILDEELISLLKKI
jgi:hypothetical protein